MQPGTTEKEYYQGKVTRASDEQLADYAALESAAAQEDATDAAVEPEVAQ